LAASEELELKSLYETPISRQGDGPDTSDAFSRWDKSRPV
jgi:hypothetical protein